jgi:xylulokinase
MRVDAGAAYGAALLGGVAAGTFADVPAAVGACVQPRDTISPDPMWTTAYEEVHARYAAHYAPLRALQDSA